MVLASLGFTAVWAVAVTAILISGSYWSMARRFRNRLIAQWKPSVAITVLFLTGVGLGGRGLLNPYAVAILCQSRIGLSVARGISSYEPLTVLPVPGVHVRWCDMGLPLCEAWLRDGRSRPHLPELDSIRAICRLGNAAKQPFHPNCHDHLVV